ncbi:MAG: restriction endonuclease [Methanosarcinales archaeon]|nr:restriction endonuclease [Methanosarcinales archaeon]
MPGTFPTAVTRAASILCETCDDYGDFYDILVVWLLLKASAPKASVVLNFGDFLEGPDYREEAATFLNRVKEEAATKALAFQHAFSLLLAKDAELDLMHRRYQVSALLADLSKEEDPQRKGHLLEDICCQIFTLSSGLTIESTRLNNKDEELDIVLRNNITRSFLRSPIILVECKNWSRPVSASVLRDFESKVRNHSNLCRIGIFVALNGFASTDKEVLRRLGRDDIVLVLVTGDDLRELVVGTNTLEDWLECLIARSLR